MPQRVSLSGYRPGASSIGCRGVVGATQWFTSSVWDMVSMNATDHLVGDDFERLTDVHVIVKNPGIYYVHARVNFDNYNSGSRRIVGVEYVTDYFIPGGDGTEVARSEGGISWNTAGTAAYATLECSAIVEVPATFYMLRAKAYHNVGANLELTNPNAGTRSELNIRRLV